MACSLLQDRVHSTDDRMVAWVEKGLKDNLISSPCCEQGHLLLDQLAQSPIQHDLELFQGWGIHAFSGQHVPVLHHSISKELLSVI